MTDFLFRNVLKKQILISLLIISSQTSWAACDQTLNPGADVASALANAAAGSTICLNAGTYADTSLTGITKSSAVTLQSVSGVSAIIGITLSASSNLVLKNLTFSYLKWADNLSTKIKVLNNVFTGQLYIFGNAGTQNNLIDGNTFDGITVGAYEREGRLSIYGGGDLIVSNNHFGNRGESDGIQIGGTGTVIGPGNVFENLTQDNYTRHIDSIQQYGEVDSQTITGNYFVNDTVCIGDYESSANSTITNNVFIATDTNNMRCVLDFGSSTNLNFSHNMVKSYQMRVGSINLSGGSSGVIKRNIFLDNSFSTPGAGFTGTIDSNMFTSSSIIQGTNALIGVPTFVGGATPSNYSGYQLTTNSLGYSPITDNIMGIMPSSKSVSLSAPLNLRVL